MALPSTLVWEVRPTNGTADAGGGFDPAVASPGTDFSQQDAVQVAYTDLVIGASNTLTSAATPFTSADVGNNITITSGTGFTAGIYNIRSYAAAAVTLDRSPGTLSSTGGVGNLGGARKGLNQGTTKVQASVVAGNTIWIKNEAWNEAITMSVAGASGNPIVWEGYNTTRGDAPTGSNRPRNNRASAAGNAISGNVADNIYKNIWVSNCGSTGGWSNSTANSTFINCRSSNNTGYGGNIAGLKINCEFDNNSVDGNNGAASIQRGLFGCYAHDNSAIGFDLAAVSEAVAFCISEANASHGIALGSANANFIINNTINGNTGASTDGVTHVTPAAGSVVYNNTISNNGRYGANGTDGDSIIADFNNYYGNGTAARNNFPTGASDIALDPGYTDATNGNFAVGTNMKAVGWPGVFPSGASTGYLDIGAVQRQEAAGGGGESPYSFG